jgi:DNA-binding transcriptional MerR regulator
MEGLTIGELAKHARVNIETIRYYERQELLPKAPRLHSGYRAFPAESVEQILLIKQSQELGFSLKEIKELLILRVVPHSTGADVR